MSLKWLWLVPLAIAVSAGVIAFGPYAELNAHGDLFDEQPARSVEEARQRVAAFGDRGRALYRKQIAFDYVFVAGNVLMLATPTIVFSSRARLRRAAVGLLVAIPFGFAVADCLENALIARLFGRRLIRWVGHNARRDYDSKVRAIHAGGDFRAWTRGMVGGAPVRASAAQCRHASRRVDDLRR